MPIPIRSKRLAPVDPLGPTPSSPPRVNRIDDLTELEDKLRNLPATAILHHGTYRQVIVLPNDEDGVACVAKLYARPWRSLARLKRILGWGPAKREWRTLSQLYRQNLSVPRPLYHGRLSDGRDVVVLQRAEGDSLPKAVAPGRDDRRNTLVRLGESVANLHEAGFVHGDLHVGNAILEARKKILWLDFQRSRRSKSTRARTKDLGDLDFSLSLHGCSITDRIRVRRAALRNHSAADLRAALRAIGNASEKRRHNYFRNRNRHSLRSQGLFKAARIGRFQGLRVRDFSNEALAHAFMTHFASPSASEREILKADSRAHVSALRAGDHRLVVKEVRKAGWQRRLADVLRGSPGRRAWVAGHGLNARGIGAARPLAYLELRSFGFPVSSLVILQDQRPGRPVHEAPPSPHQAESLLRLAVDLHRHGISHGDLQAPHIYIDPDQPMRPILIDLEGVRFCRFLSDKDRIQALAELNASIPDEQLDNACRLEVFTRYAQLLPFSGRQPRAARSRALQKILLKSRERAHLWRGDECLPAKPFER